MQLKTHIEEKQDCFTEQPLFVVDYDMCNGKEQKSMVNM